MTRVLIKRGNLDRDKTERPPFEDEDSYQSNALYSKGHQRLATDHLKLGETPGTDSHSRPSEGMNPSDTLILDFQHSDCEKINFCSLSPQFVVLYYRKLIQILIFHVLA